MDWGGEIVQIIEDLVEEEHSEPEVYMDLRGGKRDECKCVFVLHWVCWRRRRRRRRP